MSHTQPPSPTTTDRPTPRQLRYLRTLTVQTGQTFTTPHTRRQASAEIRRLRQAGTDRTGDIARERAQITRDLQERRGDAVRFGTDEVSGYGSNCRWSR